MKRFLLIVTSFFVFGTSFFVGKTYAAEPQPFPAINLPCTDINDPEFQSLRPYQAAPCGSSSVALFCGNKINIIETRDGTWPGWVDSMPVDWWNGGTPDGKDYWIDLSETELPILGNTELVKNSQNPDDQIDDATKVNEYLGWYLNGVNNRAEYGSGKNTNYEIVNLSGPLQKLLPQAIAEGQRIASIDAASETTINAVDEDNPGTEATGPQTHNQIVVCYEKPLPLLPYWLTNLFGVGAVGLGKATPIECYDGKNHPHQGSFLRLKNWDDSLFEVVIDAIRPFLSKMIPSNILGQLINQAFIDRWPKKIPPLPWSDKDGKPFKTEDAYRKAYNEWRGQICAYIDLPITGRRLICAGIPGVTNSDFADLFPYVPPASTPDKMEKMPMNQVDIIPSGGTEMESSDWKKLAAPSLYYAHTQETKDLSESLNQTYVPGNLVTSELPASTELNNTNSDPKCRVLNVRSNPGDDLFPVKKPADIGANVKFHVTRIDNCEHHQDPKSGRRWSTCHGEVAIGIHTDPVKVPFAEEIWKSTVSGNASTFRRIYPKVEAGAPVTCIADIPGVTKAVYTVVSPDTNMTGVEGPLGSPDQQNMDPQNASIYFPHLGSVYDYFLKGIQTALRPKGYGEQTPISGTLCGNSVACGELPNLPKSSGSCGLGSISSKVGNIPQSLKDIISAAADTYKVPPNLILGIMYGEGLFDGSNKKDWTDENVKNWSTCQPVPGCSTSGDDNFMGFNGNDWANIAPKIKGDLLKLDPNRQEPSQCNLLDAIYGEAWNLHDSADGGMGFQCFGLDLNAPIPTSCTWNANQYESAIKIAENGYDKGCFTLKGSCATGGGNAALCNNGVDGCEKYSNAGNTSHNACVWDVAHGK